MRLKKLYEEVVAVGIKADVRGVKEIEKILERTRKTYQRMEEKQKAFFDTDNLFNPFSDTRILCGKEDQEISSMIVGIDVDVGELLFVDRLIREGVGIDLVVSHHPIGKAYANFYEVMDLQVDIFNRLGVNLSSAEGLLQQRKLEVERRVSAANHQRCVDVARCLKLNLLCMHTPCDNLAFQYLRKLIEKNKPARLGELLDLLLDIPEYKDAAQNNNPPRIVSGNKDSRISKVHLEFTGGTEGPLNIYSKLATAGIDTIVAMHQSEEHFKKCKEENINVIFASHIASDTLGVNLMLDQLERKNSFKVYEFSGFRRFKRKAL